MPLYEYACRDCNQKFDALVRNLEAADQVRCGSCDSGNVRWLVSTFARVGGLDDTFTALESSSPTGGCCGGSCGCGCAN